MLLSTATFGRSVKINAVSVDNWSFIYNVRWKKLFCMPQLTRFCKWFWGNHLSSHRQILGCISLIVLMSSSGSVLGTEAFHIYVNLIVCTLYLAKRDAFTTTTAIRSHHLCFRSDSRNTGWCRWNGGILVLISSNRWSPLVVIHS